jgi:predicted alpha-1,6-mannanase (GH76 family)
LDDAIKTAQWTKENLCVTDEYILKSEGQGDGGAFKGIFVRYMKLLVVDGGRTEFLPWMKANANSAWRNRRPADNLMGDNWTVPAGTKIQSHTAASAVAVVLCFADEESKHTQEKESIK